MILSQHLFSKPLIYFFGGMGIVFITLFSVGFGFEDKDHYTSSKREVLLRSVGHEILLQSGDSTTRVLPIKKIAENEYQISFESAFTFQPDELVKTTQRWLAKDPLANDYVVSVLNCNNSSVAYGFAMSKDKKDDIVACLGRSQPKACYTINITFKPNNSVTNYAYLLGGLSFFTLLGFVCLKPAKPKKTIATTENDKLFTFGSVVFDVQQRQLQINETTEALTATETRLLRIFAAAPNETIERSRLQKEIWEDEGVIVGRSLDMFISKLRKKLELDPRSSIVVVRGKGYKLEVTA